MSQFSTLFYGLSIISLFAGTTSLAQSDSVWVTIPLRVADSLETYYQKAIQYQKFTAIQDTQIKFQREVIKTDSFLLANADQRFKNLSAMRIVGIETCEAEKAGLKNEANDQRKLKNRWKWGFFGAVAVSVYVVGKSIE